MSVKIRQYKMGCYRITTLPVKPRHKAIIRLKRRNKTYAHSITKYRKAREKRNNLIALLLMTIALSANIAYAQFNSLSNSITINGAVGEEQSKPATLVVQSDEADMPMASASLPVMIETVEEQVRRIAKEQNFKWENYLIRLANCESTLNPKALNKNRNGSIDRGLFQWNDKMPPLGGITDECAFDVECSTLATINAINLGYQKRWMCDAKI